jgi:ribosomal subunit interface protein
MNLQFHFVHITDALKDDLKDYASKRFEHLETFLHTFPEDNKMLKVDIEHHEKHNEFDVKCTLTMGGTVIHHEEVTHNPKEAIDKSEANLIRQVKKTVDKMRDKPHVEKMDVATEGEDYTDV